MNTTTLTFLSFIAILSLTACSTPTHIYENPIPVTAELSKGFNKYRNLLESEKVFTGSSDGHWGYINSEGNSRAVRGALANCQRYSKEQPCRLTMATAGSYLTRPGVGTDGTFVIGTRVKKSAATMSATVNDLLEYARIQLGEKTPITLNLADMREICQAALNGVSAAHPDCVFELKTSGELLDDFDRSRLEQVFSNLLNSAAQFRWRENTVIITAIGDANSVTVQVINQGPVAFPESLKAIFDPLVQLPKDA